MVQETQTGADRITVLKFDRPSLVKSADSPQEGGNGIHPGFPFAALVFDLIESGRTFRTRTLNKQGDQMTFPSASS
jgi:hypothetical protein